MGAIDLYSGIGGWTLGFKMAGIPVLRSYEWWKDANKTHNQNFGTDHSEVNIRELTLDQLPKPKDVDYVIGSPPCTQFSYSNRGGGGDIADGLVDIKKFLEIVEYLKPKYWAMENVPRVAKILEREISEDGSLHQFAHLFRRIVVYNSHEFGVPQSRKRMIAGNLPFELLDSYKELTPRLTLGNVIEALREKVVIDPIYSIQLKHDELTDHESEVPLSNEERRLNSDSKTHHPVYNQMCFPDDQNRPSRTITALCTRVSRESIIIKDGAKFRRLSVRERGCVQSFPIKYQFYSTSYGGKLKMIGNAIPPLLTFYIAQSMLETPPDEVLHPKDVQIRLAEQEDVPVFHPPCKQGAKYPWSRSFWLAIPGLRFGSGIRFELRNVHDKEERSTTWKVNFFYGNSKNIRSKPLDKKLWQLLSEVVDMDAIEEEINEVIKYCNELDQTALQDHWQNKDRSSIGPIQVVDDLAKYAQRLKQIIHKHEGMTNAIHAYVTTALVNGDGKITNQKLEDRAVDVFIGMVLGVCFNSAINGTEVSLPEKLQASHSIG